MDRSFLDVRAHGFARVAVCVPPVRVADPAFNADAHVAQLEGAYRQGAHYAVCPELGLSGYTCGDLFFQEPLLRAVEGALARIAQATARWNMAISVGLPVVLDDQLFNCAVTLHGGVPVAAVPKAYPPNYREFYELRWFHPASDARSSEVTLLGSTIPFGTDVLVALDHLPGFILATDVCEDLWTPVPPSTLAALAGATVLANLSASNVTVGKADYRRDLVRGSSARNLAVQLYGASGFGESTADLAWDGHGMIADRGELLAETERFSLEGSTIVADVDLRALHEDRLRQTSFGQNARDVAPAVRIVTISEVREARPAATFEALRRRVDPHPFVPADPTARDARCHEIFAIQATSLARRLAALPPGQRRVIIGMSGGRDSTLALLVACRAMDLLGIARTEIFGVTLPGFGTTDRTYDIACRLVRAAGATPREADIRQVSEGIFAAIGHDPALEDRTFENVQAWARKLFLFATASRESGIDLGTGDLSELALGWSTYGGDHMSHYGVNSGVPKTLVSELIRWSGEVAFAGDPTFAAVLDDVLTTPISPELLRPSPTGEITQHSEAVVGPYELHDFFLYWVLRFGFGPRRVARMTLAAFGDRYPVTEVRRWLGVFVQRFFANQFKRDCLPDGPKVGSGGSLSPRGDWRMPADASAAAWEAELATIPDA